MTSYEIVVRPEEQQLVDALRRHIGAWYERAYGSTDKSREMIDWYARAAIFWFDLLLQPQLERYAAQPPARVLDIGCGYGHFPVYLAHRWPNSEILATDVRDTYYRSGEAAAQELHLKNIRFSTVSVHDLKERDAFDLVVSCNMLNFMNSHERLNDALVRIWTAAKPGGFIPLHTPHYWNLREPFTGIPLLHFLPIPWQDQIVRRLGRRSTLLDVRNPSIGEIKAALLPRGARLLGLSPRDFIHRFASTHVTIWMLK